MHFIVAVTFICDTVGSLETKVTMLEKVVNHIEIIVKRNIIYNIWMATLLQICLSA